MERLSIKEISRLTFSSRWMVRKHLKAAGIALRNQRQQGKTKSQLGFGEAWRKHRIAVHQREQACIAKMNDLHSQGFSFWKIAAVLNSMKVPTKTGRGQWHARVVQSILESASETQRL